MLDNGKGQTEIVADAGLMAARQVLVQQQHFEKIMADRAARAQAEEAAKHARERAAAEAAAKAKEAAKHANTDPSVVVSLSKDASQFGADSGGGGQSAAPSTPAPAAPAKGVDISI